jgi:hypothetical protein
MSSPSPGLPPSPPALQRSEPFDLYRCFRCLCDFYCQPESLSLYSCFECKAPMCGDCSADGMCCTMDRVYCPNHLYRCLTCDSDDMCASCLMQHTCPFDIEEEGEAETEKIPDLEMFASTGND